MRKQMNGAVADAMYYYGANYGLNYGVSLPTVRQIAKDTEQDHDLALYLYKQQVRELRLAALHIAQAEAITMEELPTWAEGVINSEIAEEMGISRQGVRDLIKKAEEELFFYEEKLGLAKKFESAQSHAEKALALCESGAETAEIEKEIRLLLETVG